MRPIPRETQFDCSRALLADPYRFIGKRCRHHASDVFEARILLQSTLCLSGPRAAELFYDQGRFQRQGAAPEPLRATLFGKGTVQGLDGADHRRRKALFMAMTMPARVNDLNEAAAREWLRRAPAWAGRGPMALYPALQELLTRAVCAWAGVPLPEADVARRCRQLAALFDQAAAVGPGHLHSRLARLQAESWLGRLVRDIRAGRLEVPNNSAAHAVAWHQNSDRTLLAPRIAAAELLNVLRPTVAVSVFMVFTAHALHLHPEWREAIGTGNPAYLECFAQEIRRWYPFFPAIVARVREDFDWNDFRFSRGRRVLLDLYGTNHDPRSWDEPESFRPERFLEATPTAFNFIPQGGGNAYSGHRCPGEGIAMALMKTAAHILVHWLRYQVPDQDLDIDYGRLPALPRSRFVIDGIQVVA